MTITRFPLSLPPKSRVSRPEAPPSLQNRDQQANDWIGPKSILQADWPLSGVCIVKLLPHDLRRSNWSRVAEAEPEVSSFNSDCCFVLQRDIHTNCPWGFGGFIKVPESHFLFRQTDNRLSFFLFFLFLSLFGGSLLSFALHFFVSTRAFFFAILNTGVKRLHIWVLYFDFIFILHLSFLLTSSYLHQPISIAYCCGCAITFLQLYSILSITLFFDQLPNTSF